MSQSFEPGQRYPLTATQATQVMRQLWPIATGTPDLSRGRRFLKAPCQWEFWTTDRHKIEFTFEHGCFCGSRSKTPDPDIPPPL